MNLRIHITLSDYYKPINISFKKLLTFIDIYNQYLYINIDNNIATIKYTVDRELSIYFRKQLHCLFIVIIQYLIRSVFYRSNSII